MINDNVWYKSMLVGNRSDLLSDYELISSTILASTATTVEFSSLGDYSSTYKHLQIRWTAKNTSSTNLVLFRINNISSSSYARHYIRATGTTIDSGNASSQTSVLLNNGMHPLTSANRFTGGVMDILDAFSTNKNTTVRALYGAEANESYIYLTSGLLNNTASVSSFQFITQANSFAIGSRFSLYGIKG